MSVTVGLALLFSLQPFASAGENESFPRFSLEETNVDLGSIAITEPVAHTFSYRNTGTGPLTVDVMEKNCSCGSESHTQGEIPSGGCGYLTIEYLRKDEDRSPHDIYVYVVVHTNEPRDIKLELRAKHRFAVTAIPDKIKLEGTGTGAASDAELVVECLRENGALVDIKSVASLSAEIAVEEKEVDPKTDSVQYIYSVRCAEAAPREPITSLIVLDTTSKILPRLEIPVIVQPAASIVSEPRVLSITGSNDAKSIEAEVHLRKVSPSSAAPSSARPEQEFIGVDLHPGPNDGEWLLHVVLPSSELTEKLKSSIQILGPGGEWLGTVPILFYPMGDHK